MIKYFSEIHTAQEPGEIPEAPDMPTVESPEQTDPTQELDTLDEGEEEQTQEVDADPSKDSVKFKMWAEGEAKKAGYTTDIVISSSNRAVKVVIDDSNDIITQKDAIKLAVLLDENGLNWNLMDDPLIKSGGSWAVKFSKAEV